MKTQLDISYLNEVLQNNYQSKADMAKSIGITRSHLQEVFKNKGIGSKFLSGLRKESEIKGFNYTLCFKPEPIVMGEKKVESIEITLEDGELIASISTRDIILKNGAKVVVTPLEL